MTNPATVASRKISFFQTRTIRHINANTKNRTTLLFAFSRRMKNLWKASLMETYLRSSIQHERLNILAVLSPESKISRGYINPSLLVTNVPSVSGPCIAVGPRNNVPARLPLIGPGVTDMSVEVSTGDVKLGDMPPDTPSLVLPLQASLYNINDIYHCDLMPPSKISAHATEWVRLKCFQSGPALAKTGPEFDTGSKKITPSMYLTLGLPYGSIDPFAIFISNFKKKV